MHQQIMSDLNLNPPYDQAVGTGFGLRRIVANLQDFEDVHMLCYERGLPHSRTVYS